MGKVENTFGTERHYTKWLKDNLEPIEKVIGDKIINTTCEETSSNINGVTKFRVDIKGELLSDSSPVLVEAQYGRTDHRHLGQIMTYAFHHNAKKIVWIAEGIRMEHLRAIEELNKIFKYANIELKIYLVCVKMTNENAPYYVIADESIVEDEKDPGEYKQNEVELRYWEEFGENYLPAIEKLSYTPRKTKSDYREITLSKHYHFNLAIRQGYNQIKVELICHNAVKGQALLSKIIDDEEYITDYVYSCMDNIESVYIHDRNITVSFNANIYNYKEWGIYMNTMKNIILCLYNLINQEIDVV